MNPPDAVTLRQASAYWFQLGCISFGGPAGQIALMHEELVERRRWISEQRFLHALNYCMVLPGPEAQQLATYIGWLMHRTWGGLIAGGLFVLPSLLLLIALSWIYLAFGTVPVVAGLFYGIKPAVTAIVVVRCLAHRLAGADQPLALGDRGGGVRRHLRARRPLPADRPRRRTRRLARRPVPAGPVRRRRRPRRGGQAGRRGADRRPDAHARARPLHLARLGRVVAVCLGLWLAVIAALAAALGVDAVLTQMGWFFTKAALLTFGGAYAVLPYVYQGAVEHHHWLTGPQMIDGLALGETTPGPLIMVVAFVGFVGGWTRAIFGAESLFLAGAVAAAVVTFFTFLPSFFFIFAGGPFIESTHGKLGFTAPLTGITAAVVGVIVNLAVFFGYHVLWPAGLSGRFDVLSAVIGVAAGIALIRFKVGVIPVVLVAGLVGIAATFARLFLA